MARKRIIDPDFWLDEDLAMLSAYARLLYIGLWNLCDDNYATVPDRPEWIKIQIFPYDNLDTRVLLDELSTSGRILPFQSDGKKYWFIKNFFKYQRIDRPSKPKYPKFDDGSTSTRQEVKEVNLSKGKKGVKSLTQEYKKIRQKLDKKLSVKK